MDKYYQSLVEKYGPNFLEKAGYFEEKDLPLVKVKENIKLQPQGELILLTTGSFAPMHQGHVNMMDKARSFFKQKGIKVAASIFSFSHDDYVLTKDKNIPHKALRIQISKEKLKNTQHQTSIWELEQLKPVNFTTVIDYFEREYKIPVVYVFGKDNYSFAYAFNKFGKGLYMPTDKINSKDYEFINQIPNIEVLPKSDFLLNSRDIRKQKYVLRDDSYFLSESLNLDLINDFKKSLSLLIEKYSNHEVFIVKAQEQIKADIPGPTISMDLYFQGDYNLAISREFEFKTSQNTPKKLSPRNGHKSLVEQIKAIPKGNYTLVDDDIASGYTVKTAIQILNERGIIIDKVVSLNPVPKDEMYDIVDLRDFIIGAKDGGLQVKDQDIIFKVPYLYPYVDLVSRAKIMSTLEFTKEVLVLNLMFYKNSEIKVKNLIEHKDFFLKIGFKQEDRIETVINTIIKDLK